MKSPLASFFKRPQSCNACDAFFRRRKGSTRALADAGKIKVLSQSDNNLHRVTVYVDPTEVARAFGGEVVQA